MYIRTCVGSERYFNTMRHEVVDINLEQVVARGSAPGNFVWSIMDNGGPYTSHKEQI